MTNTFILILALIFAFALSEPIPNNYTINPSKVTLAKDISQLQYSPNQRWLVALSSQLPNVFYIYNGIRKDKEQNITVQDNVTFNLFAFSEDSSVLFVGTRQGIAYGFDASGSQISSSYFYKYNNTVGRQIMSISISKTGLVAIAFTYNFTILEPDQSKKTFNIVDQQKMSGHVQSLAWAHNSNALIYGIVNNSTDGGVGLYDYEKKSVITKISNISVTSVFISKDDSTVFVGNQNGDIKSYYFSNFSTISNISDSKNSTKIHVSQNSKFIVAQLSNPSLIKIWHLNPLQYLFNTSMIAFSSDGNQILIPSTNSSDSNDVFQRLNLCTDGTFFSNSQCIKCMQNCSTCFESAITCQSCIVNHMFDENKVCQQCSYVVPGCSQCNEDGCTACNEADNWNANPTDKKCTCKTTFFLDNNTCTSCSHLTGCIQCASKSECAKCNTVGFFNETSVQGKCVCNPQHYIDDDNKTCANCSKITGCVTCKDKDICNSCNVNGNFNVQPRDDGKCTCRDSYFLNGDNCKQCNQALPNCGMCQNADTCTKCQDQNNRNLTNNCKCNNGLFDNKGLCTACSTINCVQCSDDICTKCNQKDNWVVNNDNHLCQCMNSYYEKDKSCLKCSSVLTGCLLCDDQNTCLSCDESLNFNLKPGADGKCVCQDSNYLVGQQCKLCSGPLPGCINCQNEQTCLTCNQILHFNIKPDDMGKCICQSNQYYLDEKQCSLCAKNLTGCTHCSSGQACLNCDESLNFNEVPDQKGQCVCKDTFYLDLIQKVCTLCNSKLRGCVTCKDQNACLSCDVFLNFNPIPDADGKCVCKDTNYLADQKCKLCSDPLPGCINCQNEQTCLTCNSSIHFNPKPDEMGQCVCQDDHYYFDENACLLCSNALAGCITCSNNKCLTCDNSSHFNPTPDKMGICFCENKQYYFNDRKCSLCSKIIIGCITCQDSQLCLTCNENQNFNPTPTQQHQCNCINTHYYKDSDQKACLLCSNKLTGCITCLNSKQCQTCDVNSHFNSTANKQGLCNCESTSYYLNGKQCQLCSKKFPGCTTCHQDGSKCLTCDISSNYIEKPNDQGECLCVNHYFQNQTSYVCELCSTKISNCQNCQSNGTSNVNCSSCNEGYDLNDDHSLCLQNEGQLTLWMILAIILGMFAVSGSLVACIKCIKKKKSPMQDSSYSILEGDTVTGR